MYLRTDGTRRTLSNVKRDPLYAGDGVVTCLSVTRLTPYFHHSSDYDREGGGVVSCDTMLLTVPFINLEKLLIIACFVNLLIYLVTNLHYEKTICIRAVGRDFVSLFYSYSYESTSTQILVTTLFRYILRN